MEQPTEASVPSVVSGDPLPFRVAAIVFMVALLIALGAPLLFGGDVGTNLAVGACALAAWLGINSERPAVLEGHPQLCSTVAVITGGLTIQTFLALPTLALLWQQTMVWGILVLLCYLSGKPLSAAPGS